MSNKFLRAWAFSLQGKYYTILFIFILFGDIFIALILFSCATKNKGCRPPTHWPKTSAFSNVISALSAIMSSFPCRGGTMILAYVRSPISTFYFSFPVFLLYVYISSGRISRRAFSFRHALFHHYFGIIGTSRRKRLLSFHYLADKWRDKFRRHIFNIKNANVPRTVLAALSRAGVFIGIYSVAAVERRTTEWGTYWLFTHHLLILFEVSDISPYVTGIWNILVKYIIAKLFVRRHGIPINCLILSRAHRLRDIDNFTVCHLDISADKLFGINH